MNLADNGNGSQDLATLSSFLFDKLGDMHGVSLKMSSEFEDAGDGGTEIIKGQCPYCTAYAVLSPFQIQATQNIRTICTA